MKRHSLQKIAFAFLSEKRKSAVIRRSLNLQYDLPVGTIFKLAETQNELEQALHLLYEQYVKMGYMKENSLKLRVTPWHALPTTTTLIAKQNERVIGTVSVIRKGLFGLPLEGAFDLSELTANHKRVAEISALAVDKEFQSKNGIILFPIIKFLYHYCLNYFGTDYIAITVHPDWYTFYNAVLGFKKLGDPVKSYGFVEGAPAVGAYIDLQSTSSWLSSAFFNKPLSRNLHHFIINHEFNELRFPDRRYFKIDDPTMTTKLFSHFFRDRVNLLEILDPIKKQMLLDLYENQETDNSTPNKLENFIDLAIDGQLAVAANQFVQTKIISGSAKKLLAKTTVALRIGSNLALEVAIGKFSVCKLKVKVTKIEEELCHLDILYGDENWQNYIGLLNLERNSKKDSNTQILIDEKIYYIKGPINEFSNFSQLYDLNPGVVTINLNGVTSINSPGIIQWINLMRKLKQFKVTLVDCRLEFIFSLNMIPDMAPSNTVIKNLQMPFRCIDCSSTDLEFVLTEDALDLTKKYNFTCKFCHGQMIEDAEDDYIKGISALATS